MKKFKIYKIKNGPTLLLAENKKMNQTDVLIKIGFGGFTTKYIVDGQTYTIMPGTAHLLEHAVIEDSPYGNMIDYEKKNYARINGFTNSCNTTYTLNVVRNINDSLEELLNMVNKPILDSNKLLEIKKPIFEEINTKLDYFNRKYSEKYNDIIYGKRKYIDTIGSVESVNKITADDLKKVHKIFYQPKNQTITLIGHFDTKEIIELVEDYYKKLDSKNITFKEKIVKRKSKVENKVHTYINKDKDESTTITYMSKMEKLKPLEMKKYIYYLDYFLYYNFDDSSNTFKTLIDNRLSLYSFNIDYDIKPTKIFITIVSYTSDFDKTEELIKSTINNKTCDENSFNLKVKKSMISYLTGKDNFWRYSNIWYDNIERFNYKKVEGLNFFDSLNYNEYKEFINKLDFTNYFILRQVKEEK